MLFSGQIIVSLGPRFCFNMVFIMIYLFVIDDSMTSQRFTKTTEQLTSKCCEPLQKLLMNMTCEIDLCSPVILYY